MVELYCGSRERRARILTGIAVRAAAREKNVLYVSFGRDNPDCGRLFETLGVTLLSSQNNSVREYFDGAVRMAITFKYHVLIFDDILDLAAEGSIPCAELLEFLSDAPDSMEVICGGETADGRFLRLADEAVRLSDMSAEE